MFYRQLKNELIKLFGKKRTYIGFGAFLITQTVMLLMFRYTNWHRDLERMLNANGYVPDDFISDLTVAVQMLIPQILLLMPLYATLVGGDLVAKEAEDGTLRMTSFAADLAVPAAVCEMGRRRSSLPWCWWWLLGVTALAFARVVFPWNGMFVFVPGQAFYLLPAGVGLERYALAQLALAMNATAMVSCAFMFSCFNMKPAAATILALSFVFLNAVMESIPFFDRYQDWFITYHFKSWLLIFHDPIPWAQIMQSEIILVAFSATAFVVGSMAFQVRDIKS